MNDKKLGRVNEEIRRILSDAILSELKDPRIDLMTTVVEVKTSRDLQYTTVFLAVPEGDNRETETLEGLESAKGFLRKQIAEKLDLRIVPEIRIKIDHRLRDAMRMTELIDKVRAEDRRRGLE